MANPWGKVSATPDCLSNARNRSATTALSSTTLRNVKGILQHALLVSLGIALNMSSPARASAAPSTTTSSTISGSPVAVAPLTGLPDPRHLTKDRAALTIKIDNTPQAMPQAGVQEADVVYEEIVEGGITRLAAIYNSRLPTMVGPVRSVRRTDREIVFPLGGIFAFSGGADYALRSIATAPVALYSEANAGAAMFRDPQRYPPHNLFANAALLMRRNAKPRPTRALFQYLAPGTSAKGPKVRSFVVGFAAGYAVSYVWNPTTKSWDRSLFGRPDVSANGVQLAPKNVIVMSVNYVGGAGVLDSYAQLVGSGPVEIFVGGHLERGTWIRHHLAQTTSYVNASGKSIRLEPGQTWVELLDHSEHVTVITRP